MSCITIQGGTKLQGEVILQGSKNAVLPILAASVLCKGTVVLRNCPDISDVRELLHALSFAGMKSSFRDGVLKLDTTDVVPYYFGPEFAGKTRGGVLLLGAFLGRFHEAGMSYPGGCVIGARPIDLHCKVFRRLQVLLSEEPDGVCVKGKPCGGCIRLAYPSVGATENAILAAVCAEGCTVIHGAAKEPEVTELCSFLVKAGAKIAGIGTACLVIDGVRKLHGIEYTVTGDRIVAGTYLEAVAMTGGEVVIRNTGGVCMHGITDTLRKAGIEVFELQKEMYLKASGRPKAIPEIMTAPFPAFPTDMQSQTLALLSVAEGDSRICETVFESRFGVVSELRKLGAEIKTEDRFVSVRGAKQLFGAEVTASDLRGGAALVLAGLAAEGVTTVYGYEYIARGYEDICGDLQQLGARIEYSKENDRKYGEAI